MPHTKCLLLIDDDTDDHLLFTEAVQSVDSSASLVTATGCEEAVEKLKQFSALPDVIFVDMNMPQADGVQCLAELKSNQQLKDVPVIVYSTFMSPKDKELARSLGAMQCIEKPDTYNGLCDLIKNAFVTPDSPLNV